MTLVLTLSLFFLRLFFGVMAPGKGGGPEKSLVDVKGAAAFLGVGPLHPKAGPAAPDPLLQDREALALRHRRAR